MAERAMESKGTDVRGGQGRSKERGQREKRRIWKEYGKRAKREGERNEERQVN